MSTKTVVYVVYCEVDAQNLMAFVDYEWAMEYINELENNGSYQAGTLFIDELALDTAE